MSDDQGWNDQSRDELRNRLRSAILGELRLARRGHEGILEACREVHIQEDCPERELNAFIQFAADELDRAATQLAFEQAGWPNETDCDRLDRVELVLRERGILLWQVSPCCDTCTRSEFPDRIDVINSRYPGFRDRVRGYAFFIDQNMPEMLAESVDISVYLAYGWISPDGSNVASEIYAKNGLGVADEICECLRDEGFKIVWDGELARKIGVSLNWRRRTTLQ
jgi:hypothetical protein